MSKEPELSIKVSVDPVIDGEHLGTDIQNQIDKINELPKVEVTPDVSKFGSKLGSQIKKELRAVNDVLDKHLAEMSRNIALYHQAANTIFDGVSKSAEQTFKEIERKGVKPIKSLSSQLDLLFQEGDKLKELGKFDFSTNVKSAQKFNDIIDKLSTSLVSMSNAYEIEDEDTFSKSLKSAKKYRDTIVGIINDLHNLSGNKAVAKAAGVDKKFIDSNVKKLESLLSKMEDFFKLQGSTVVFDNAGFDSDFLGDRATEISEYRDTFIKMSADTAKAAENSSKKISAANKKTNESFSMKVDSATIKEITDAQLQAIGALAEKQAALNTIKKRTIRLESNLTDATQKTVDNVKQQVDYLKTIFNDVSKSELGNHLDSMSEYMRAKAELDASKNAEAAKSLSLNVNSSSAKEYEAALKGIKDRISELGKEGAFDGLNNNIDENERAFINAKEYIKDYASALDEVKSKSRDTRLPQQRTTGLNVSNIENYSQKVTAIKNDLYALKDTVFPAVYSDINRTYGHLFDDSITNVQSYIDKLNEIPAAASSKAPANRAPAKTQHNKNTETIDSTNIKNYAALLNGIQGAMNDMKTTIVPGFDKVLSENGKKIADIGASLVNYVAVLKRGLKAVDQSEKNIADKTAKKPAAIPAKNNVPAKNPTTQKIQDTKVTVNSNEVIVTGDPVNIPGKVELKDEDIKRPNPLNLNGSVKIKASDVKIDDVEISKKEFDIKGNLILKNAEIANAVKTATKEAAKEAQSKKPTAKAKNGLTDRDFERKSKELLTSLASIMKGKARIQNSFTNHTRKGQSEAAAEDSDYLSKLSRRERTTKSKLTKLYKGRGGHSAWENSSIYHSAIEDSEHIRNSRLTENSDKDKAAEEEKYISALRQRSIVYKELAAARRKYGNDSEYVKSSQKELQDALNIINQFESKVDNQYLQAMPERRKVFAENMSNLRKSRDDIQLKSTKEEFDLQQKGITNYINQVVSAYGELDKLYKKKSRLTKPEDAKELDRTKTKIDEITQSIQDLMDAAEKAGTPIDGIKEVVDAFDTAADSEYFSHIDFNDKQKGEVISELTANYTSALKQKYAYMTAQLKTENQAVFDEYQKLIDECDTKLSQYGKDLINNGKSIAEFSGLRAELSAKFHDVEDKAINNKISKIENDDAKKEQVYVSQLIKDYKILTTLTTKRASLVKPEDADRLKDIDDELQRINARVRKTYALASKDGFNLDRNFDVQEQLHSLQRASKISKREFAKNQQQYNANQQTATIKKNTDLLAKYNQELTKQFRLYKELKQADPNNAPDLAAKQLAFNNQKTLVNSLRKEIHQKKLNTTSDYKQLTNQYNANVAGLDSVVDSKVVNAVRFKRRKKGTAQWMTIYQESIALNRLAVKVAWTNQHINESGVVSASNSSVLSDYLSIGRINSYHFRSTDKQFGLRAYNEFAKAYKIEAGTYSTVLGSDDPLYETDSETGPYISFTPLLQTNNGLIPLLKNDLRNYFDALVAKIKTMPGGMTPDNILAADATGIDKTIYGQKVRVKCMIAAVEGMKLNGATLEKVDVSAISGWSEAELRKEYGKWTHDNLVVEVASFKNFYLSDNSNKRCSITFLQKDTLGQDMPLNSSSSNAGGWANTSLREYLDSRLVDALPIGWKQLVKQVKVPSSVGGKSKEIVTSDCYFFIPSAIEMSSSMIEEPYIYEGQTISYMTGNESRIKHDANGEPTKYWLRSPFVNYDGYFYAVEETGELYGFHYPSESLGVTVEFSI